MASPDMEVFIFLRATLDNYKATSKAMYSRRTRGWREEKELVRKEATERVKEKVSSAEGFSAEELLKIKWNIIKIANNKLAKEKDELKAYDLKILWEMVKAEVGEITSYQDIKGNVEVSGEIVHTHNLELWHKIKNKVETPEYTVYDN